jgi:hypothetical protein
VSVETERVDAWWERRRGRASGGYPKANRQRIGEKVKKNAFLFSSLLSLAALVVFRCHSPVSQREASPALSSGSTSIRPTR